MIVAWIVFLCATAWAQAQTITIGDGYALSNECHERSILTSSGTVKICEGGPVATFDSSGDRPNLRPSPPRTATGMIGAWVDRALIDIIIGGVSAAAFLGFPLLCYMRARQRDVDDLVGALKELHGAQPGKERGGCKVCALIKRCGGMES